MTSFIKIYYYMCLAVGLVNIHYDRRTESLQLYHWITIAYTGIQNLLALTYQPFAVVYYFKTTYYCEEFDALAVMNGVLTISFGMTTVVIILEAWLKRKRFQQLCYGCGMLVHQYLNDDKINENREIARTTLNILLRKLLSSVCKLMALYVYLYNRVDDDDKECAYMDGARFIAASVYLGFLNTILIFLDINVVLGLLLFDLCISMLINALNVIKHEAHLMATINAYGYTANQKRLHKKWRRHLSRDVETIISDVRKIRSLAKEHIEIYQFPMLFMLLSMFMGLISLMFHIVSYIDDTENFKATTLAFLLMVVLANIINSMLMFTVCESLTENFKKMSHLVYEIRLYASLANRGVFHKDPLEISLDTLAVQLRYQRFKVSICGLFEMNHSAGMTMLSKMILYLMFLLQSVIKSIVDEYNEYYDENSVVEVNSIN